MNLSPEEAAQALQEIEASRSVMRRAIQSHRGHLYLWLWGGIWVAVSILNWMYEQRALATMLWIMGAGLAATAAISAVHSGRIRARIDPRFMKVCATLLVFGYCAWPYLLGDLRSYDFRTYKGAYGYFTVIWMQLYMVAGIWFDNFWFWVGLFVTVAIIASLMFFPALFWATTLLLGLVLVGSGFVVRYRWS